MDGLGMFPVVLQMRPQGHLCTRPLMHFCRSFSWGSSLKWNSWIVRSLLMLLLQCHISVVILLYDFYCQNFLYTECTNCTPIGSRWKYNFPSPALFFKDCIYLFLGSIEGWEKEREENRMCERNIDWLRVVRPLLGTCPTIQACVLPRNQSGNPLVYRPALNPLSHTSHVSPYQLLI